MWTQLPAEKGQSHPAKFLDHVYCGQMAGWMKTPLGTEVDLGPVYIVLDGEWGHSFPAQNGAEHPKFSAHLYYGQTAGCTKMPLGTEVGLGLRDSLMCRPRYPQKKWHIHPTQFLAHVFSGQMAGWMKTPLGMEVDLGPGHIVLDGVPAPAKGAQQYPLFGPCLLWPRSPISATAELL